MASTTNHIHQDDAAWIPEGYATIIRPDGQHYVVPEFYIPALNQIYDGYRKKKTMKVSKAKGNADSDHEPAFNVIGEGKVMVPPIPESSDRERLSAHAEVLALQERLGISYKDASHRLYMAEFEKLKVDEKMYKAFAILQNSTEKALEKAYKSVRNIEGKEEPETVDSE